MEMEMHAELLLSPLQAENRNKRPTILSTQSINTKFHEAVYYMAEISDYIIILNVTMYHTQKI